ncbi:hypothetical protein GGI04_003245 [Coemansia thaxteri]|uniref:CHCH domain-containing protein n=1 Tax=Coemansia thaxteri TaxID=2663907 RepID=A0A9W8EHT0_9FUNG|nr:hypothetical protein H4R26_004204 [Coemansia thaxteri]KAJ2002659.1 hypothetical protein GGI04_003245 [Coemansia thaxteri]KAJ2471373.1 hypothetical protein GGI02_002310 [Coemansia sp. RSA 2322]
MAAPAPTRQAAPSAPSTAHHAPTAQPQQPGLFAQMAATAGGVAVGSAIGHTVGHAVTGMFGGSDSSAQPAQQQQAPLQSSAYDQPMHSQQGAHSCDVSARDYIRCLEASNNDMETCKYYRDMLKLCQSNFGGQSF